MGLVLLVLQLELEEVVSSQCAVLDARRLKTRDALAVGGANKVLALRMAE